MAVPRAFKTDESFLEKIAIGATGTRRTFEDLTNQGHDPLELERGSMSFKVWKAIKIKRLRVPDILCIGCGRRVESRAKTKLSITMSHSLSTAERGWDFGLDDEDRVALVACERVGDGPLDWRASGPLQYIRVEPMREAFRKGSTKTVSPKGAQEGFEIQVTWPAAIASSAGVIEYVDGSTVRFRRTSDGRVTTLRLRRKEATLSPLVAVGDEVVPNQIVGSVVPVSSDWKCPYGAGLEDYLKLATSRAISDRYAGVKALARFPDNEATAALLERVHDTEEHVYVRVDAAAGLMRRGNDEGEQFFNGVLKDEYLENRLEGAIVLGEVATDGAAELLIRALEDDEQDPQIRAGAAWALGEVGTRVSMPALMKSFGSLATVIRVEAARALAKVARRHLDDVVEALPSASETERPGIAWALSKAGGFDIKALLPALTDEDARQWVAYIVGTQNRDAMLADIESLARQDPEVYFAVTVLWKIMASWTYDLDEY